LHREDLGVISGGEAISTDHSDEAQGVGRVCSLGESRNIRALWEGERVGGGGKSWRGVLGRGVENEKKKDPN